MIFERRVFVNGELLREKTWDEVIPRDFHVDVSPAVFAIHVGALGALVGVQLEGVWFNRALALIMIGVLGELLPDDIREPDHEPLFMITLPPPAVEVFGRGDWYGTLRSEVTTGHGQGRWVLLEIDVAGAQRNVSGCMWFTFLIVPPVQNHCGRGRKDWLYGTVLPRLPNQQAEDCACGDFRE